MRKIISLGGSLIIPGKIDVNFLKKFRALIISYVKKKQSFALYCGGGALARNFQNSASKVSKLDNKEKDWIGIEATKLNAYLLRTIFGRYAEDKIITDPTRKVKSKKPILVAAGWKPGWSTDYDAVLLAKNLKVNTIINMTNVDYVYDKNPKKYGDANPLKEIAWKDFRKLVGNKWDPGLNMPFDPIAAREAERLGLKVVIIGKNLNNLKNFLDGKKFNGTVIK